MMEKPRLLAEPRLILLSFLIATFILVMQMRMQIIVHEKMDFSTSSNSTLQYQAYAQPSNVSEDQPKKNLYLHAGPGKIATTTVQSAIKRDVSLLQEDGYCTYRNMGHFEWNKATVESITSNPSWEELQAQLDKCHRMNQHVILSKEGLLGFQDEEVWNDLLEPLFSRWNVIHLVGYRRYYDWRASLYGQGLKVHGKYRPKITESLLYKGGDELYTLNNMKTFKRLELHETQVPEITAQEVRDQRLGEQNPNKYKFAIYNLNEGPNVLKTLYCNVLPYTYKSCEKYTNEMASHDNKAIPMEYYRLILGGIDKDKLINLDMPQDTYGAIEKKIKLSQQLRWLWEEEWNKTIMDFPRDCLSTEELQGLFDKSMAFEQLLVPDYFEKETLPRLTELKQEFDDMANLKYCSVQVGEILHAEKYKYIWDGLADIISGENVETIE